MSDFDDDEGIGYGRPPKRNQFQKGQSGNPRGRPKTSQTVPEIVARLRDELIPITIDGRRRHVRLYEAAIRQTIAKCLKNGHPRDLERLLAILEKHGITPYEVEAERAKASAESAVRKIMTYIERAHPDNDPMLHEYQRQEVEIIDSFPACRAALEALWAIQDADRRAVLRSGLRHQVQQPRIS